MAKLVFPCISLRRPSWISFSVRVSTLLVASSRIIIFGSGHHRPGDGDHLALSLAQVGAALGEHGVIALGQVHNKVVGIGLLGGFDALLFCGAFSGIFQVVHHGIGEQEGLLQHDTDLPAQTCLGQLGQVLSIDQDCAAVDVVVTGQDID